MPRREFSTDTQRQALRCPDESDLAVEVSGKRTAMILFGYSIANLGLIAKAG